MIGEIRTKVAVATKLGVAVDLHFGHATSFWIYQIDGVSYQLLEVRNVDQYCHGHHGSQSAMQKILQTIADCQFVLCAKIGVGPSEKCLAIGVEPLNDYAYESVHESLIEISHKLKTEQPAEL